jgi:Kef-type K+ transport system membrane component KefB
MVFLFTGVAAATTILASLALTALSDRSMDQWHRSAARFSSQWGWTAGSSLVALLIALAPIRELIVSWMVRVAPAPDPAHNLVLLAFVFGFMTVVIAQSLCALALNIGWRVWMTRPPREPR